MPFRKEVSEWHSTIYGERLAANLIWEYLCGITGNVWDEG